ncbi:hypothetical protein DAPPUDRAFT_324915 [Daphnia pulex]|uniref:Uncharacterized protein n=1 Tax=Daphnia pulex TaxID=6669 RepID=E9H353_DAPPU|nr:hypothetical protein DAPPUDRAFT_324915 [Daphnia pulex]|eukprot:EFX73695.1 hypothetical protein DAPPUDRAFT_324915 [Daphnia pulex]
MANILKKQGKLNEKTYTKEYSRAVKSISWKMGKIFSVEPYELLLWNLILRLNSTKIVPGSEQTSHLPSEMNSSWLFATFMSPLYADAPVNPKGSTNALYSTNNSTIAGGNFGGVLVAIAIAKRFSGILVARKSPKFRSDAVTAIPSFTAAVSNVSAKMYLLFSQQIKFGPHFKNKLLNTSVTHTLSFVICIILSHLSQNFKLFCPMVVALDVWLQVHSFLKDASPLHTFGGVS